MDVTYLATSHRLGELLSRRQAWNHRQIIPVSVWASCLRMHASSDPPREGGSSTLRDVQMEPKRGSIWWLVILVHHLEAPQGSSQTLFEYHNIVANIRLVSNTPALGPTPFCLLILWQPSKPKRVIYNSLNCLP